MEKEWVREIRDQCVAAQIPFRIHRASGILLVINALVHGSLAVLADLL